MIADSIKYKGHRCFKNDWVGFDSIKPINLIIGRNNTGKSHMIDFVRVLCKSKPYQDKWRSLSIATLDEATLRKVFSHRNEGGHLLGNHWEHNGKHLIGSKVSWEAIGESEVLEIDPPKWVKEINDVGRRDGIKATLGRLFAELRSSHSGCIFRHLLADRDIRPEEASTELSLADDGRGATNIIRRYLLTSNLDHPREVITNELRSALNEIYESDGQFSEINIKIHDESNVGHPVGSWEVFLTEESKGQIPLSRSGSGLKTVLLVLLNLLVIPRIEGHDKRAYVFAFEELENNLHPALQRRLLKYIASCVVREQTTVFLTTHSSVALDFFAASTDYDGPRKLDSEICSVLGTDLVEGRGWERRESVIVQRSRRRLHWPH